MDKTICELFAGVGGFRLGFERSSKDWRTVWFSQWEPGRARQWAHECYVRHFGDIDERTGIDISLVDKSAIPDHTLLVGGFPCQDYSVARPLPGSRGLDGKKGVLWWQIRDTLEAKRAPFGLFENVDRLLKSPATQRGRDFGVMLACLDDLGYSAEWRVVNAADYGGPQRRRRVFIFAYKNDTAYAAAGRDLAPEEAIRHGGFFASCFPVQEDGAGVRSASLLGYDDIPAVSESFGYRFEDAGLMRGGVIYTLKTVPEREPSVPLREIVQSDVDEKYYLAGDLSKWEHLKGSKRLQRTSKTGHEYTFSEGAVPFPDSLDAPARTILTSEGSLNRSTHIIEDPATHRMRRLTPVEAERIQGFDDGWTDTGMPERARYFCMGNALVVPMITRMADALGGIIEAE